MSTRHAQSASTVTEAQVAYYQCTGVDKVAKPDFFAGLQGVESLPYPRDQVNFRSLHTLLNRAIPFTGRALCTF